MPRPSRLIPWLVFLLVTLSALPIWAQPRSRSFDRANSEHRQMLIQTDDISSIAKRHGLEVLDQHETPEGTVWLVEAPLTAMLRGHADSLIQDPAVKSATAVALASLPAVMLSNTQASEETADDVIRSGKVWSPCLGAIDATGVWRGYADQRAAQITRLHLGHYADGYWCGNGITIAVIDTAIDSQHPLLAAAMVTGYDFMEDSGDVDATQTTALDTKTRAIVESSQDIVIAGEGTIEVFNSAAIITGQLDEDAIEDLGSKGPFFGHGTMVAGLIRLTAPRARIMPLEAFSEDGVGHPFDIVRAIDYAVDNGAHVINMSFSISDASPELLNAVERARAHGVMTVAAAGNNGELAQIYPAGYGATIGVAATDFQNQLSDFSNFGLNTAAIAAPGSGVVTTFPGGLFASGWGTSFAAPLVSGNVALIRTYHPHLNQAAHRDTRLEVLLGATFYSHLWQQVLASGRIDTVGAVLQARD